ncbi:MAG: serine kinase [Synergistaceae bacterium]
MKIGEITSLLNAKVYVQGDTDREITGVIAGDLLSFIMGTANENSAWITIQTHLNVAAVAVLKDLPLIIIASDRVPAEELIERCKEENISIISLPYSLYEACNRMYEFGYKK